jgi:hypothetical protein
MSVTAIPTTVPAPVLRTPEAKEGPGPDHDADADDKNVSASAVAPAAPKGMGAMVDSKA